MEKKKNIWHLNSFRTVLGNRYFNINFFRKLSLAKFSSLNGFTLIELLIVIAVIGVLAAGIFALLNPLAQIQKANDARRKGDLSQIQKALEVYYNDFEQYPAVEATTANYRIMVNASTTTDNSTVLEWGSIKWKYMGVLPKDPSSSRNYIYYSPASGQSYYLYASLERGVNDVQVCKIDGSVCANVPGGASCGSSAICNYGVSSPNVSP